MPQFTGILIPLRLPNLVAAGIVTAVLATACGCPSTTLVNPLGTLAAQAGWTSVLLVAIAALGAFAFVAQRELLRVLEEQALTTADDATTFRRLAKRGQLHPHHDLVIANTASTDPVLRLAANVALDTVSAPEARSELECFTSGWVRCLQAIEVTAPVVAVMANYIKFAALNAAVATRNPMVIQTVRTEQGTQMILGAAAIGLGALAVLAHLALDARGARQLARLDGLLEVLTVSRSKQGSA